MSSVGRVNTLPNPEPMSIILNGHKRKRKNAKGGKN